MAELIIKRGSANFEIKLDRSELVEVHETADGVALAFKGGLQLLKADSFMPSSAKNLIKNTLESFPGKKIIVDLDDYTTPARVDAT